MLDVVRDKVFGSSRTDPGVRAIFDGLVLRTALARGSTGERSEAEMRGFEGAINYELTGAGGGGWHAVVEPGHLRFHRGLHSSPHATVSVGVDDFFRIIEGELSPMVAQMTGRVRVRGEAHAVILFATLVAELQRARRGPGLAGRLARGWLDGARWLSPTVARRDRPARPRDPR